MTKSFAHCQIPCGIYDDKMRFTMMEEHITTIEKSINQIVELSKESSKNMNQIVRWVMNKEEHADELTNIATYYFLTQRIKPVDKKDAEAYKEYLHKLTLIHEIVVFSMKVKQTTDLANVEKLRKLVADFNTAYFKKHEH